ncbi:MAG: NAD(P)-dependent oxidoreductase [Alphaproteobacteria bacterium]|jgi:3-hydroxyisobutyrate dehydrogenase|nr:NAD(P)-dependent oxidoreductase [Alphaproteobacteria bacterium]
MTQPEIGIIGLGNMGRGIATNFAKAGHATAVWDISEEARANLAENANIQVAAPGEMAAAGVMMIYVVPATPEIEASFEGDDGVLARAAPGTIIFDLTTSYPEDTKKIAAHAAEFNIAYLDAAMSGGATGADAGTLTLMIGGDKSVFEACRPKLEAIADNLFFLGGIGSGHTMKLIHNMVTHALFLTTCEAGRMAERAGLKLSDMIDVFNVSNARSYASEARFPRHILSEKWDARSRVYNLNKDLGMVVRMAENMGMDPRYAKETSGFLNKAIDRGMAEDDYSLLYKVFDDIREDG